MVTGAYFLDGQVKDSALSLFYIPHNSELISMEIGARYHMESGTLEGGGWCVAGRETPEVGVVLGGEGRGMLESGGEVRGRLS